MPKCQDETGEMGGGREEMWLEANIHIRKEMAEEEGEGNQWWSLMEKRKAAKSGTNPTESRIGR